MAQEAKEYLYSKNIPTLLESLLAGLMYHKPDDPITFLEECLVKARNSKDNAYDWDTFHKGDRPQEDNLSLASTVLSEINSDKVDPSPTEGGPKTGVEINNDDDENLKAVIGKPILFVLGGPGSGKGTQCSKIVEDFGFLHLSAGDLLRAEVAKGTEQGKELEATMKEGKLVPAGKNLHLKVNELELARLHGPVAVGIRLFMLIITGEVTVDLLKAAMVDHPKSVGYLIDGFPRELEQGELFKQQLCDCTAVLMFDCPEEVMVERLLERGKTSGRVDDNEETIRKRFHTFQQATLPVVEHYQQLNKVKQVDSTRSPDEVYCDVKQIITELTTQKPN